MCFWFENFEKCLGSKDRAQSSTLIPVSFTADELKFRLPEAKNYFLFWWNFALWWKLLSDETLTWFYSHSSIKNLLLVCKSVLDHCKAKSAFVLSFGKSDIQFIRGKINAEFHRHFLKFSPRHFLKFSYQNVHSLTWPFLIIATCSSQNY